MERDAIEPASLTGKPTISMMSGPRFSLADPGKAVIILTDGSSFSGGPSLKVPKPGASINVGKKEFWLGISGVILTVAIAVIGSVWSIASHVNNSINDSRKELQSSINTNKLEMTTLITSVDNRNNDRFNRIDTQFDKMGYRVDKVESKMDDNFKETNKNINEIKNLIVKSK